MNKTVAEASAQYLPETQEAVAEKVVLSGGVLPGYKQTEVGGIPEDWDVVELACVSSKITDGTHDTPKTVREGRPFLTAIHVKENRIDFDGCYFVSEEVHQDIYRRCNPEFGDILMVNIGAGTATTAVVDVTYQFSLKNVALIKPNTANNGFFVNYALCFTKDKTLESISSGGAQPFLSLEQISHLKIAAPLKKEQTAIANALSDVDALIHELEKLIAKKQAIKTATMQQLLTGKTRLPPFAHREDGTPKGYKQSELGEIPEDWEVFRLGDLGSFKNGINKDAGSFGHGSPFVNLMDVFGKPEISGDESFGLINSTEVDKKVYGLIAGDVLFIRSSVKPSGVGLTTLVDRSLTDIVYSGFLIRFRSNSNLSQKFKKYCFYESSFRNRVIAASTVSANTNINQDALKDVLVLVPSSNEEQAVIAAMLSDMDEDLQSLEQRLSKTRQIKQGMMQELLTGKTRLVILGQSAA